MVASTLLLLAASLAPLCVRAAVPRDKIHPNSVYSQLPRSKHNKHADMKIFYQTGVCTTYKIQLLLTSTKNVEWN